MRLCPIFRDGNDASRPGRIRQTGHRPAYRDDRGSLHPLSGVERSTILSAPSPSWGPVRYPGDAFPLFATEPYGRHIFTTRRPRTRLESGTETTSDPAPDPSLHLNGVWHSTKAVDLLREPEPAGDIIDRART